MNALTCPETVQTMVQSLPKWVPGMVRWSVKVANHGPRWVPVRLRAAPLWCMARIVRRAVDRLLSAEIGAPGYGVQPHGSEAQLTAPWHWWHRKANPAGLAPDARHTLKAGTNALTRHEKPDPEPSGSAGTQDPEFSGSAGTQDPEFSGSVGTQASSSAKKFN
ncbi:MAG: hypothetical protein HHJ16_05985 [Polaromonas sp.]|uniref:hypothetical protein n=1 Tax=Polaromonas sp. TaxID=1869339 RepID=UPI00180D3974|nr:hypothetical protein [Polaromonas sp.]NMM09807.1 hypothetical protein [Polaromonas sp.]